MVRVEEGGSQRLAAALRALEELELAVEPWLVVDRGAARATERARAPRSGEDRTLRLRPTPSDSRCPRAPEATSTGGEPPPAPPAPSVAQARTAVAADPAACERLVEEALARVRAEPFNAVVHVSCERARREAQALRQRVRGGEIPPLAGVALLHKDILATSGVPTEAGSEVLRGWCPAEDAAAVALLAKAGAVTVGKANTHEFATGVTGTVSAAGPTRNPCNPDRIPGGSSCGSAAAVAAGLVSAATATDTGGSIRIPAACCGVVGFKPTYGRVSRRGVVPFAWSLDHVGTIAASVEDTAALFAVLATGGDGGSRGAVGRRRPGPPAGHPLAGIRYVLAERWLARSTPAVAEAVRAAAAVLDRLGAVRVQADLPEQERWVPAIALATFLAEGGAFHAECLRCCPERYQPATRAFLQQAAAVEAAHYVRAQCARRLLCERLGTLLRRVDLLVAPTLPTGAPPLGAATVSLPEGDVDLRSALTAFTRPFNLTGQPAISLPCGFDDGLPVGLQLVAAVGRDAFLLRAAAAYEHATDRRCRPPTA